LGRALSRLCNESLERHEALHAVGSVWWPSTWWTWPGEGRPRAAEPRSITLSLPSCRRHAGAPPDENRMEGAIRTEAPSPGRTRKGRGIDRSLKTSRSPRRLSCAAVTIDAAHDGLLDVYFNSTAGEQSRIVRAVLFHRLSDSRRAKRHTSAVDPVPAMPVVRRLLPLRWSKSGKNATVRPLYRGA